MGCNGSTTASAPAVMAEPAKATLLDASPQKPVDAAGVERFSIFLDTGADSCFEPAEDTVAKSCPSGLHPLRVKEVKVGSLIGLWNDRKDVKRDDLEKGVRRKKVRKNDFVLKVRKAVPSGCAEWVAGDANLLLEALAGVGPFEIQIRRARPDENMEVPVEVQLQVEPVKDFKLQHGASIEQPRAEALAAELAQAEEPPQALETTISEEVTQEACITTCETPSSADKNVCYFACF